MKTLTNGMLCLILSICSIVALGQPPINEPDYNKPKLFQDLPEKLHVRLNDFESLFEAPLGKSINIPLHGMASLNGHIVSKSSVSDTRVQSVVVRLTNRKGANFTFTRIINEDGSFEYMGRIISREHGDSLEIVFEHGQYVFQKVGLYDLIAE
ncbi:MAG: hypothetical protein H0V30_09530 [Chitinophagaceae bacterium]|jgi:hypothetical protein|nr:hypothetical protein [Chitinophagaceae bacterium]